MSGTADEVRNGAGASAKEVGDRLDKLVMLVKGKSQADASPWAENVFVAAEKVRSECWKQLSEGGGWPNVGWREAYSFAVIGLALVHIQRHDHDKQVDGLREAVKCLDLALIMSGAGSAELVPPPHRYMPLFFAYSCGSHHQVLHTHQLHRPVCNQPSNPALPPSQVHLILSDIEPQVVASGCRGGEESAKTDAELEAEDSKYIIPSVLPTDRQPPLSEARLIPRVCAVPLVHSSSRARNAFSMRRLLAPASTPTHVYMFRSKTYTVRWKHQEHGFKEST